MIVNFLKHSVSMLPAGRPLPVLIATAVLGACSYQMERVESPHLRRSDEPGTGDDSG